MTLNPEVCYQALLSLDPRFDGKFFVGVTSTRIYCRPVCTARKPHSENCTYYPSAAAAEQAGYRPCLRCRPELAPGNAHIEAHSQLASAAASRIEDGVLDRIGLKSLAEEFHVSERQLRRVIKAEFGVSPVELAQTNRLLTAKRLLTDTNLPVIEVAFASGFNSLRRFNALFMERYRLSPTNLRKNRESVGIPEVLTGELAYRPPMDWQTLLAYLKRWAASGVESIEDNCYLRTINIDGHSGWLSVEPLEQKATLKVRLSAGLAHFFLPVMARLKRLFDLSAHPQLIATCLGDLAAGNPGLRIPGAFDGFEMAVHAVLSQQVSTAAARQLMKRLVNAFGQSIETPYHQLDRIFPTPHKFSHISLGDLAGLGMYRSKAQAILGIASALDQKILVLDPGGDVDQTLDQLKTIPGVGEWTAQYIAMRALAWPDAFPPTDLCLLKATGLTSPSQLRKMAEAWRPWRAYAAMHLWDQCRLLELKKE